MLIIGQSLQTVECASAASGTDQVTFLPNSPIDSPPPSSKQMVVAEELANPSAGLLPGDFPMASSLPPKILEKSEKRHVPTRIDTDLGSLSANTPESMIDSPWPLSPLLSGTTAAESIPSPKGSVPSAPKEESDPITLAAVFSQLSVHPTHSLEVPQFLLQQRTPRRLQTNSQPKLSVRFDDLATPTNLKQTPLHSAIPFSPCTPKAMSFTAPWVVSQSLVDGEEIANSLTVAKASKPNLEELTTPVCRAYYFDSLVFPRPSGQEANLSAYEEDAPMLALQSDCQDSVMIYDRVGERMLEVSASTIPPWSTDLGEEKSGDKQETIAVSGSTEIAISSVAAML
jgi:hypothetical protein